MTAFCSLIDRQKLTWLKVTIHASNRERPEKFRIFENNKVIYFSLKFPWPLNWLKSPFREIKYNIVPENFHLLFSLLNLIDCFRNYTDSPTKKINRIKKNIIQLSITFIQFKKIKKNVAELLQKFVLRYFERKITLFYFFYNMMFMFRFFQDKYFNMPLSRKRVSLASTYIN